MPGEEARELALEVLLDYERRDAYLNVLLQAKLSGSHMDRRDRALVTEMVQGCVRMKRTLDWALQEFSDRDLESLDRGIRWILRLSGYQILFMNVPEYAACDLGADLARGLAGRGGAAYVNGVLRTLCRGKESLRYPSAEEDPAFYLEVVYSHPRWVVDMWMEEIGFETAESICRADNVPPPVSLRCNLLRVERDELAAELAGRGLEVTVPETVPECLLVRGTGLITGLEEYRLGYFSVQDQASIMVGHAVRPEPGMEVLDICAAPGGKANHLAELMRNTGRVLALDINPRRLELVREEAMRLGNSMIETRAMDATRAGVSITERFDRVLVDAPCSGLGTLDRRPDVRWRKKPEDIDGLAALQAALLEEGSKMVKPGGFLVYSTCTISKRENEDVVGSFLAGKGCFMPVEPGLLLKPTGDELFVRVLPGADFSDGTFISVMQRSG